jgi:hypothetical protein
MVEAEAGRFRVADLSGVARRSWRAEHFDRPRHAPSVDSHDTGVNARPRPLRVCREGVV